MAPRPYVIKNYSRNQFRNTVIVIVIVSHSHNILIFSGKAGAYPSGVN
jgi:hypothetical protein